MRRIYCIKFYNFKRGILLYSILAENLADGILEFWNFAARRLINKLKRAAVSRASS